MALEIGFDEPECGRTPISSNLPARRDGNLENFSGISQILLSSKPDYSDSVDDKGRSVPRQ